MHMHFVASVKTPFVLTPSGSRISLLFYSQRGFLYYSTPREDSFTILLPERIPLLFYSQRGFLYYSTPREEFITLDEIENRNSRAEAHHVWLFVMFLFVVSV